MKKIARAIISMGVVFAFAACSWEVPQNVSVKTNADYNFSLGTFEKEFDNNMDLNSMMGDTGVGKDDIHTYDYIIIIWHILDRYGSVGLEYHGLACLRELVKEFQCVLLKHRFPACEADILLILHEIHDLIDSDILPWFGHRILGVAP